jgi:hypothetical protein
MQLRRGCAALLVALAGSSVHAESLLYDNGKWISVDPVNTPVIGSTPGISYRLPAPPPPGTSGFGDFGWPVDWLPNTVFDGAADDFTLAAQSQLTRIRVYAYETSATNTEVTITGGYLRVWNEKPSGPRLGANDSRIVAGFVGIGPDESDKLLPVPQVVADPLNGGAGRSVWTGVYRRAGTYDASTSRPVMAVDFDVSSWPELDAGTYWLEVSLLGGTAGIQAWVPTEELKGERGLELAGDYVDAEGSGAGQTDDLGRTNIRPEIDFAFELYGDEAFVVPCNVPFADADDDGDVDGDDFGIFQRCYTGAANPPIPAAPEYCTCFDRNGDDDVDQDDLGTTGVFDTFENCASGPTVAANPGCAAP